MQQKIRFLGSDTWDDPLKSLVLIGPIGNSSLKIQATLISTIKKVLVPFDLANIPHISKVLGGVGAELKFL